MSIPRALGPVPVEGAAIGAAPFDGNKTDSIVTWLFMGEEFDASNTPEMMRQLVEYTKWGHLAWVVFPPLGFRL